MRSLLTLLVFCFCLSVAVAQSPVKKSTTAVAKKASSSAKKSGTTAAKKVMARPRPTPPPPPPAEPAASTLTFPSTDPDNVNTMDATRKQQLYDELHGVKAQSTAPDTGKKGKRGQDKKRDADESATRADRREVSSAGSEAGTYIGIRAGGNYSTFLDAPVKTDPNYGFHVGVVFQFGNGGIAFQPEVNFHQDYEKTVTAVVSGTSLVTSTSTASVNSLVVPLFAKFQFGQQGSTRFFVNVGPYGAYSLESRPANSETVIGYGAALGLGVGIPMGSGKFTVEARGYYPLGSTAKGSEFGNVPGKPIQANLSIGYLFPLGGR